MNISLAPITSKGMMNAMEHHSNNRLYMAQIPLSHYFGTCRQVGRFRSSNSQHAACQLRISVGSKLESWQLLCLF